MLPPGWMMKRIPAAWAASTVSRNGKKCVAYEYGIGQGAAGLRNDPIRPRYSQAFESLDPVGLPLSGTDELQCSARQLSDERDRVGLQCPANHDSKLSQTLFATGKRHFRHRRETFTHSEIRALNQFPAGHVDRRLTGLSGNFLIATALRFFRFAASAPREAPSFVRPGAATSSTNRGQAKLPYPPRSGR